MLRLFEGSMLLHRALSSLLSKTQQVIKQFSVLQCKKQDLR
jgi:hypothetical protein